ncbi:hypothetical protein EXIGLDRAFT_728772 [Exidia glandulosa HHB12029]|uniref:Uncharacterized protein n=1 Tax=Exidia glandulosa HHB12029 TaxID=1314781 RepID=A0A165CVV7_EXIGL|nr:hypothetical protein EXIGLDRAFT_728772 [Exidia glandulosa HHB12029]
MARGVRLAEFETLRVGPALGASTSTLLPRHPRMARARVHLSSPTRAPLGSVSFLCGHRRPSLEPGPGYCYLDAYLHWYAGGFLRDRDHIADLASRMPDIHAFPRADREAASIRSVIRTNCDTQRSVFGQNRSQGVPQRRWGVHPAPRGWGTSRLISGSSKSLSHTVLGELSETWREPVVLRAVRASPRRGRKRGHVAD